MKHPTAKLSGSGGLGETHLNACAISGKPRSVKKRRSRCPLQLMLGSLGETGLANSQENAWERKALKPAGEARKIKARLENNYDTTSGQAPRPDIGWESSPPWNRPERPAEIARETEFCWRHFFAGRAKTPTLKARKIWELETQKLNYKAA